MARTYVLSVAVCLAVISLLRPISCDSENCTTTHYLRASVTSSRDAKGELVNEPTLLNSSTSGVTLIENRVSESEVIQNGKTYLRRFMRIVYSVPPPPVKYDYISVWRYGSLKYHVTTSVNNMYQICKDENAQVAYPETFTEALIIANKTHSGEGWISVGLKKHEDKYIQIGTVVNVVDLPDELWDENGTCSNGDCIGLIPATGKLHKVSCDIELPFLCKRPLPPKEHTIVIGQGSYKFHYKDTSINDMETICVFEGGHVAYPRSLKEANIIIQQSDEEDNRISVGLMRITTEYQLVGSDQPTVNIRSELWNEEQPGDSSYDCVALSRTTGKLDHIACDTQLPFVCRRPYEVPPMEFVPSSEVLYEFSYRPENKFPEELDAVCSPHEAYPAYPWMADKSKTGEQVAAVIASFIPESVEFIATGLKRDLNNEGKFILLIAESSNRPEDEVVLNNVWAEGEPSNVGDCVVFQRSTQKLRMHDCNDPLPFICAIERF